MNMLMKFSLLGAALVLAAWGWFSATGAHKSQRCDHQKPKTFKVNIVGIHEVDTKGAPGRMKPVPKNIVACNGDDIEFEAVDLKSEFEIIFKPDESPFKKNLKSEKGRVMEKVVINPSRRRGAVFIEYDVKAPGYELLDPKIIITPR